MIQQASFEDFFGVLFTIVIVLLAVRWLFRLLLPYILKYLALRFSKKIMNSFNQQSYNRQNTSSTKEEKISFKEKKKVGEYIEFEELD